MDKPDVPETDLLLLELLRDSGNQEAWERFHALYKDLLAHWCGMCGLQVADAHDVSQIVLLKLLAKLHCYDPALGRFHSWRSTVVHNAARDYRDKQRRREAGGGGTDNFERLHSIEA